MTQHNYQLDENEQRLKKLREFIIQYKAQLNQTASVKVMNACIEKIHGINREIKSIEKKIRHEATLPVYKSHRKNIENKETNDTKSTSKLALLKAEQEAKLANEKARKAKVLASKNLNTRKERSLPSKEKSSSRWMKEQVQQQRKLTNKLAKSADNAVKIAVKQLNMPGHKITRRHSSPRLFDHSTPKHEEGPKNKRSPKK